MNDNIPPVESMESLADEVECGYLPDAMEIAPGVTLATRDGLQIGNAIVIKEVQPRSEQITRLLASKDQKLWLIETDFGNTCRFSDSEIHQLFVLRKQSDYDRWWEERMSTIQDGVNELTQ